MILSKKHINNQTDKAILFEVIESSKQMKFADHESKKYKFWVPKSICKIHAEIVEIPDWFLEKKQIKY